MPLPGTAVASPGGLSTAAVNVGNLAPMVGLDSNAGAWAGNESLEPPPLAALPGYELPDLDLPNILSTPIAPPLPTTLITMPTPALPSVEQGPSADALDDSNIMAVSAMPNADGGYDVQFKYKPGWTDAQKAAADAKVAALNDATPTTGVSVGPRSGSAALTYQSAGKAIPSGSDVDHTIDLQLGGKDSIENMAPLDQSVNRSLGAQLNQAIRSLPAGTRFDSFSISN